MMSSTFWLTRLAVAVLLAGSGSGQAPDCTQMLMGLASCTAFVMTGSIEMDPDRTCCTELTKVLPQPSGPACLCNAFNNRAGLNDTRALSLPKACEILNNSFPNCTSLPKLNAPPNPVVENPPADHTPVGTPGAPGSSASSLADYSFLLFLSTLAAASVSFIF